MLTYASLLDMITLICTNHYNRTISSPSPTSTRPASLAAE